MGLYVRVCVYDTSDMDLLRYAHLVFVESHQTLRDVLADLLDCMAEIELLVVKLPEFESTPDSQSLQGLLETSQAEIDYILQQ
jgi:hypothetical protein